MSLILPTGPSWAYCSDNFGATAAITAPGTAVTPGGSNVKGSAAQVLSALAHDVEFLRIGIQGTYDSGNDSSALFDVMVDPAGGSSYSVLIPDLCGGFQPGSQAGNPPFAMNLWYDLPVWIPAGATVAVRAQSALASPSDAYVGIVAYGGNRHPEAWWCGQRVTAIGINASTSKGAAHTPGSGVYSSWGDIGSPLSEACGAVQFAIHGQYQSGFQMVNAFYRWQFGVGGEQIGPTVCKQNTGSESTCNFPPSGPVFTSLPAGAQFQARGERVGGGTGYEFDVAVYAVH